MNIIFLTLLDFNSYKEHNIYCDLLREFVKNGHNVYCISPTEKKYGIKTHFEERGHLLKLRIGNIQKTNIIEKGISTIRIESQFVSAVKKYFSDVRFDLVLYSTPPITLVKTVNYIKKRDNAQTYLLLKDIFPQNAVDLGMITTKGIKGIIYKYFRHKEKKLYDVSDKIGCMSPENSKYILKHNSQVSKSKVEVCPNCIDVQNMQLTDSERFGLRQKYDIPQDKRIFVYGGNLGKPQGIAFLIECLTTQKNNSDAFFLIVGDGTEYTKLEAFFESEHPINMRLLKRIPKEDYDRMIAACDIGMIFLDNKFTIPNFPSRLLSYMQAGLPVLACTDVNTDVGAIIEEGNFGFWCESSDTKAFSELVLKICALDLAKMSASSKKYLLDHYTAKHGYEIINEFLEKK